MADFTMPALGADMESGKVVQWLVEPGGRVRPGDVVAVVETHKGAIDVECFLDGVIDDLAPLNEDFKVGAVLARVRKAGDGGGTPEAPAVPGAGTTAAAEPVPTRAQVAARAPAEVATPAAPEAPPRATPQASPAQPPEAMPVAVPPPQPTAPSPTSARVKVSPAARRRAGELGIDAGSLRGTGGDGAVTLADVELAHVRAAREPAAPGRVEPAPAREAPAPRRPGFDPTKMRQAIAAAMARSKREIPHYYLTETIDFSVAGRWLESYNAQRDPADRLLPAVLLLKATARALAEVPQLNGFYEAGGFRPGSGIHVGWAVSLRGGGLVAPAIHDVDRKSLPALMAALRDLVQRARTGRLRSSELTDPTVTVTSLGERGAESVLGVIYPPQVALVGFGRVAARAWVVGDRLEARPVVAASLAADHRASDGHVGGVLLAAVGRALQDPEGLDREGAGNERA